MIKFTIAFVLLTVLFKYLIKVIKASTTISIESKVFLVRAIVTLLVAIALASVTLSVIVILF